MSLSPQCGAEDSWVSPETLRRGETYAFLMSDESFEKSFSDGIVVTRRGPTKFHVSFPALESGYFATCAGSVVVYVPPGSGASAEVKYNRVQARRCRIPVYTSLGTSGTQRPAWATSGYATRWWNTASRGLGQPLQDAILTTGSQTTCVFMVKVRCRSDAWFAIWRVDGGLYTYDLLRTLHTSGRKALTALLHELSQSCPEVLCDDCFTYFGLKANPELGFPDTKIAPADALRGNSSRVQRSPLTKLIKFFPANGGKPHLCADSRDSIPRVDFRPGKAVISMNLPPSLVETTGWTFSFGISAEMRTDMRAAQKIGGRLQCTVWTQTWAKMAMLGSAPWLSLYLCGPKLTATVAIPRFMLSDVVASGRGWGCDETRKLKPCVLLTRTEFLELGDAVGARAVVAAAIEDSVDLHADVIASKPQAKRPRTDGGDSRPRRSRKADIQAGVEHILADDDDGNQVWRVFADGNKKKWLAVRAVTGAKALERFSAISCPTWRHVAATLRCLVIPPTEDPGWSGFLAASARRLKKLPTASVLKLVDLLRHAEIVEEYANVVAALHSCGFTSEAAALGQRLKCGQLRYLCIAESLPPKLTGRCYAEGRVLGAGAVGIWLRLIVTEPSVFKLCPKWKTGVTMPMYGRATGTDIYATASTEAAKAVDAAVPWQRKKVALDRGVLAYVSSITELTPLNRVRFTDALKVPSV